jgi:hypothetical protein
MEPLLWKGGFMVVYVALAGVVGWLFTDEATRAANRAASKRYREALKAEELEAERWRAIERLGIRERRSWKEWFQSDDFWQLLQIIGFFLFIAFVAVNSEERSLSLGEYVEMATRQIAESAQRCRKAIDCDLWRRQVEALLHGSGAERCVYGDGNYEACRDAAYELLEERRHR